MIFFRSIRTLLTLSFFSIFTFFSFLVSAQTIKNVPIQDGGRIKPFDTFARETLQLLTGKETYEGKPAYQIIMTWVLEPSGWEDKPLLEVKHHLVKKALKLEEKKLYTINEIWQQERLPLIFQELRAKRDTKEKLDPYFQAIQRLESQLFLFRETAAGRMLRLLPAAASDSWRSLAEFTPEEQTLFAEMTKQFIQSLESGPSAEYATAVNAFVNSARTQFPQIYPGQRVIDVEVFYNEFHPYRWAWIFYLIGFVLMGLSWLLVKDRLYIPAWVAVCIGLGFNIFGMALRIYLIGRPPVTNMYETVVWVGFGAVIFAMIIEAVYKWRFILLAGSAVGAFTLVLANMAPAVLDKSLHPLEPVLRSNFWLTIHVMTITISYAAFFLALALGDICMVYFLKGEKKYEAEIKAIVLSIYRCKQIGISFLAPGIILGGIWADYSWGRFWGWDPKETWALIALLGYIAVLHGRLAGWIKDFGMAASGIITFSLVIMAWYGVNFVLGAGLHSYGFGAGGVEYVSTFVAIHILFVIFVFVVRQGKLKAN
jgi:cytochrome c-type biogenesis protein CcsB